MTNNTDRPMELRELLNSFGEDVFALNELADSDDYQKILKRYEPKFEQAIQATREDTLGDVSKVMVDWAFRKYPSRKVLTEVAKYINTEVKSLTNKSEK